MVTFEDIADTLPNKSSIREHGDYKGVNETRYEKRQEFPYRRVDRWLKSFTNQPWNDVYSQFLKLEWIPIHKRNLNTLNWLVELNTHLDKHGNVIIIHYGYLHGDTIENYTQYKELLYVHPESGLLQYVAKKRKRNWKKEREIELAKTFKSIGKYHCLKKLDGIWYEFKSKDDEQFAKFLKPNDDISDFYGKTHIKNIAEYSIYVPLKMSKRQLSSKELKANGLTNF